MELKELRELLRKNLQKFRLPIIVIAVDKTIDSYEEKIKKELNKKNG